MLREELEQYLNPADKSYRDFAQRALDSGEVEKYKIYEGVIDYIPG